MSKIRDYAVRKSAVAFNKGNSFRLGFWQGFIEGYDGAKAKKAAAKR